MVIGKVFEMEDIRSARYSKAPIPCIITALIFFAVYAELIAT